MHRTGRSRADSGSSAAFAAAAALVLSACGPVLFTTRIDAAERKLQQARDENARWYAPYEYYYAEAHLEKARTEAAEASYEDALRYARTAEQYSVRALQITAHKRAIER